MTTQKGPFVYELWREYETNSQDYYGVEIPLFSDTHITGLITNDFEQDNFGPFEFLNALPMPPSKPGIVRPVIILRYWYRSQTIIEPEKYATDTHRYHGGGIVEEVSALISILLGNRLRPGKISRNYFSGRKNLGTPWEEGYSYAPTFLIPSSNSQNWILPSLNTGDRNLNNGLLPLTQFIHLAPDAAIALVRSARFYQDAVGLQNLSLISLGYF